MNLDESEEVRLTYSLRVEPKGSKDVSIPGGNREHAVIVSGANFNIKPAEKRTFSSAGVIEKSLLWSIKAKSTGSHNLVINIESLFRLAQPKLTIHNQGTSREENTSNGEFSLPVTVYTIWNIPQWLAKVIGWLVALVAFVFTVPFLKDIFRKFLKVGDGYSTKAQETTES